MRLRFHGAFPALLLFACCMQSFAQYTAVSGSHAGPAGAPVTNATMYWQLTSAARIGTSGGQLLGVPVAATVTAGAFSMPANSIADTSLSNPANPCYAVTIIDNISGATLLGAGLAPDGFHVRSGGPYGCVQPSGSSWSFVSFIPAAPPTALVIAGPMGPTGVTNWRGAWAATTAYARNDGFVQSGNGYIVTTAYTSGGSFGSTDTMNSVQVATGCPLTGCTLTGTLGGTSASFSGTVAAASMLPKTLNGEFECGGYTASGSNTQLDVCWNAVEAFYTANASSGLNVVATVNIPSGINQTCYGIQVPAPTGSYLPLTLRLIGAGKGEFGTGATIQASCSLSTAVITEPWLLTTGGSSGYWSDTVMSGFTVDANNLAPSCLDVYGQRFSQFGHISCENATGSHHWISFGDVNTGNGGLVPSSYQGIGLNDTIDDIFVYARWAGAVASVTATPSAGALSFTVSSGGQYYGNVGPLAVYLRGIGAGAQPCTAMPTGLQANLTYNSGSHFYYVSGVTATTYGSGCTGSVYVAIPGAPIGSAAYAIIAANTDSSYTDLQADDVGLVAGLKVNPGGSSTIIHPHFWGMAVGIEDYGQATYLEPELDTNYSYGINFKYGLGTKVYSPRFVFLDSAVAGAGSYLVPNSGLGSASGNVSIYSEDCGAGQTYGGYQWFIQDGVGPVTPQKLEQIGYLNRLDDGHSCGSANSASVTVVPGIFNASAQTVLGGTTAGYYTWSMPELGASWKTFYVFLNAYENTTATAQTIALPVSYAATSYIVNFGGTCTGVTTTGSSVTLPSSMAGPQTGLCAVMGY